MIYSPAAMDEDGWKHMLFVSSVGLQACFNASGSADNILEEVSVSRGVLIAGQPANMQERASARRQRESGLLYRYLHALLCCYLMSHCFTHFLGPPDHNQTLTSALVVADIKGALIALPHVLPQRTIDFRLHLQQLAFQHSANMFCHCQASC